MQRIQYGTLVRAAEGFGHDRLKAVDTPGGAVFAIADGAGGTGGGGRAADLCLSEIVDTVARDEERDELEWVAVLRQVDEVLQADVGAGETTAVVVEFRAGALFGASVGDSGAVLVVDGQPLELTGQQIRKPLLGGGGARPIPFRFDSGMGTLLLGSDGLWKYSPLDRILRVIGGEDAHRAPDELLKLAQLPSGALQDDIAIIIAECTV